jgi:hypothetical protein
MICTLKPEQLKNLYVYINKALIDSKGNLEPEVFMKELFDQISEKAGIETAYKFLQPVPKLILKISADKDLDYKEPSIPLKDIRNNFLDTNKGLENIISYFTPKVDAGALADAIVITEEDEEESEIDVEEPVLKSQAPIYFMPLTAASTTFETFKPVSPEKLEKNPFQEIAIDKARLRMLNTIQEIADAADTTIDSNFIDYKGQQLAVYAMPLRILNREFNAYLDPITKSEIARGLKIGPKATPKPQDIAILDRKVLVITDKTGIPIVFDKEGNPYQKGNAPEDSLLAFQYLRNVQEDGKVYEFFGGKLAKVITSAQFASRYNLPITQAEKILKSNIDKALTLKKQLEKTDKVQVKFEGLSDGVDTRYSSYTVSLVDAINQNKALEASLKSMQNQTEASKFFAEGVTTININGTDYALDRVHLPENIAKQITDILYDKDLSIDSKYTFIKQFIPFNTKQSFFVFGKSKKTADSLTLEVYDKLKKEKKKKALLSQLINSKTLSELSKEDIEKNKEIFYKALTTAWANKGMPLAYRPELIKGDGKYLEYINGKIVEKDYYDFILSLNPLIKTNNLPKEVVNKYMVYDVIDKQEIIRKPAELKKDLYDSLKQNPNLTGTIVGTSWENSPSRQENSGVFFEVNTDSLKNEKIRFYNVVGKQLQVSDIGKQVTFKTTPFAEYDGKKYYYIVDVYVDGENVGSVQETDWKDTAQATPTTPQPTQEQTDNNNEAKETEQEKNDQFQKDINPSENTPKPDIDLDDLEGLDRAGYTEDNVTKEQLDAAKDFWFNTEFGKMLQKHITLVQATNLANSNVFAKFFISGATLANPDNLATIALNTNKGTFVDIYHEAWHAFSQLYLSKQEKTALYNEVKNFKDAKGNQPYKNLNFFQIEETIAEDFRTYMKSQNRKDNRPKRNTLFRRIWNFLKALFNKKQTNSEDIINGVAEVPVIKEWFDKLNFKSNDPKIFKDYSPLVENSMFSGLDRGISDTTRKNVTVLNQQESDLVSNSIDMIISEYMDNVVEAQLKAGKDPINLQSVTLGLLLNVKNRSKTYTHVKKVLEDRLQSFINQYQKQTGIPVISEFKTKQDIIDNSIGQILTEKNKDNKYVFLKSQIDTFKNLIPDIKRGDRVKGEDWHGIRIVGDYYDFIDENNKRVGIIVVSDPEDATIQYNNYVRGGAKKYNGISLKEVEYPILTEEQELLLDNIKILQMAVDNFGDPEWEIKQEKATGVIAYHLKNSSYDLKSKQFEADDLDSEGEELDPDTDGETKQDEIDRDAKTGKKSILQLAQKEVIYVLNSIPKIENKSIKKNRLGFNEKADFKKLWNILSKTTGGIRDRQIAYDRLLEAAKLYPEIEHLMKFKYPNPKTTNDYAMRLSISFFQTFSIPSVNYKQLTIFKQDQEGNEKRTYLVTDSSLEINSTIKKFGAYFTSSPKSKFIDKTSDNNSILNLEAVINEFQDDAGYFDPKKTYDFLNVLGVKLDLTAEVQNIMKDPEFIKKHGISRIFDITKKFLELSKNPSLSRTSGIYLNNFIQNPVETLNKPIPKTVFGTDIDYSGNIRRLAEIQASYGFESANPGILLPDGNKVFGNVNHSLLSTIITDLNDLTDLNEIKSNPIKYGHLNFLLDSYGFVRQIGDTYEYRSKLLGNLFDEKGKKKSGKSLEFLFTAGTQIADETGINTSDLDIIGKAFQEFHSVLLANTAELTRAAEKKSAFGVKVDGKVDSAVYNNIIKPVTNDLWTPIPMFNAVIGRTEYTTGEVFSIGHYLLPHLASEFDRAREIRSNKELYDKVIGYSRKLPNGLMAGESFGVFEKMLSDDTKASLYKLMSSSAKLEEILEENDVLRKDIIKDIIYYFNNRVEEYTRLHLSEFPEISPNLYKELGISEENLKNIDTKKYNKVLVKAYLYNAMISKVETFNLFTGDIVQYNHSKEEASKRIPGASSDGKVAITDQAAYDFINDVNPGKFNSNTYASKLALEDPSIKVLNISGTLNTAVIKDAVRRSVYLPEIEAAFREEYEANGTLSKKQIDDIVEKDLEPYTDLKESDGAAYLTFDAYRAVKYLFNDWSPIQEQLYQDIINGKDLTLTEYNTFFPVTKLHYYGPASNEKYSKLNARLMHKFAVAPINPKIAKPGTALNELHTWMLKNNVTYTLFGSGSKATTFTKTGKFDDIFADESQARINMDASYEPNAIYLNYLKEVTAIAAKFKTEVTVPTQKRVLVLDALYNLGELKNTANKDVVDRYIKGVDAYTNILKTELLNKIGFKLNDKGVYTGKLNKFIEMVRDELGQKEVPEHLIKLLDSTPDGDGLTMDFSIHPEADLIEKIIVNKIQKSIVKQKTTGESLVQVPTTFMNGIWDVNITSEANLGTNNLAFYKRGDLLPDGTRAKTSLMKVAIALQGDFKNLLNLPDPANVETTIGNIDRLNELVKDSEWLKEHADKITIAGPRIPTDAINSIEAAEIWHFLDESFGNTVVVPTEIVAKAGSDFDADKIFFMFPNINPDGNLPTEVISEEELIGAQIQQQKRYLQNNLIANTKAIIELPDNYVSLVKPNAMYLVKDHVESFREAAKYNPKEKVHNRDKGTTDIEMSSTTALEEEYNLSKHEQNLSGNLPLGILAKKNKWHTLMKTIGAVLPKTYNKTVFINDKPVEDKGIQYDMRFRLPVNRTEEGNVSISNEYNVDNVKIGDVFSHALQGVLDRAKDPWPFLVQIVTEALPVMNHYLEAGASVPSVLNMMKSPLVESYIRKQVYNNSPVSEVIRPKLSKSQVKKQSLLEILDTFFADKSAVYIQDLADRIAVAKLEKVKTKLKNSDVINKIQIKIIDNAYSTMTPEEFLNSGIPDETIKDITAIFPDGSKKPLYFKNTKLDKENNFILGANNYYAAAEVIWDMAFNKENATESELKYLIETNDTTSLKSLAVLLHVVQAENQFEGMDSLEMAYNPDTAITDTTVEVIKRKEALDKLFKKSNVDTTTIENLVNNSILSSFYQNKLILDLVLNVFPVRLHNTTLNYLINKLDMNSEVSKVFGKGLKGQERFINSFNNGLINYIYQTYTSDFIDEKFNLTTLPSNYKGVDIEQSESFPEDAVYENGKIKVNLTKIQEDYNNTRFLKDFTRDNFSGYPKTFKNITEYKRYIILKQYLKHVYPIDSLSKNVRYAIHLRNNNNDANKAYEIFLSERSLMNSYNRAYIMGTTKYKYTDLVLDVINTESYKLKEKYPVLAQLSKASTVKIGSILQLDDKALAKGEIATGYYKNLRQLGDLSVRKVVNKAEGFNHNEYITDTFKNFSMFMFHQHGVGYSPLTFSKIYDPEQFVNFMKKASNNFVGTSLNEITLDKIYKVVINKERFKEFLPAETNTDIIDAIEKDALNATVEDWAKDFTDEDWFEMETTGNLSGYENTSFYLAYKARQSSTQSSTQITNLTEFTNYSGAAKGADTVWSQIGKELGLGKQVDYTVNTLKKLTEEQKNEVENAYRQAATDLGRKVLGYDWNNPDAKNEEGKSIYYSGGLVRRDYLQAKAADAVYAIGTLIDPGQKDAKGYINKTNKKIVSGGTGYAVQMAINLDKTVFVFNQADNTWWMYDNTRGDFGVYGTTPTLTKKFAGIGTREINDAGKQAIRDVYQNTISQANTNNEDDLIEPCNGGPSI